MIDPMTALSFSIYNNKGVYALLLGSGVSRAANIPTGWEIVMYLVKRLATLNKAVYETDNEYIDWYMARYNKYPDYRDVIKEIAPSPSDRRKLLASFFEPDDADIAAGNKVPTKAHKVVANLVREGFIRVIITTNFDRLLERALVEVGIEPSVISTSDAVKGAMPLAHSKCTIVKIHGDYNDIRIKNTIEELAKYEKALDILLDRILDEYGMVVCGWSSIYDIALRKVFFRCKNHRFSTFWTSIGQPVSEAKQLIDFRFAEIIYINSADMFFSELEDRIKSLCELDCINSEEKIAIISLVKKYVRTKEYDNLFHDMILTIINRLCELIATKKFSDSNDVQTSDIDKCIKYYESISDLIVSIYIIVFYWGSEQQQNLLVRCLEKIADIPERNKTGFWNDIKYYPSLLMLYAGGLSLICSENYSAFANLLMKTRIEDYFHLTLSDPIIRRVNNTDVFIRKYASLIKKTKVNTTACSEYLECYFRDRMKDIIFIESDYTQCFDRFEYYLSLLYAYYFKGNHTWHTVGHYAWRNESNAELSIMNIIDNEIIKMKQAFPLVKAGLFDGNYSNLLEIKKRYDLFAANVIKANKKEVRRFRKIPD